MSIKSIDFNIRSTLQATKKVTQPVKPTAQVPPPATGNQSRNRLLPKGNSEQLTERTSRTKRPKKQNSRKSTLGFINQLNKSGKKSQTTVRTSGVDNVEVATEKKIVSENNQKNKLEKFKI
jgi:hypothetical protein